MKTRKINHDLSSPSKKRKVSELDSDSDDETYVPDYDELDYELDNDSEEENEEENEEEDEENEEDE